MGHKPDRKARKKRRGRETAAEKLRALSDQRSQEALKHVDAWEKACRARMDIAAKSRAAAAECEVHSAEVRSYPGAHDAFVQEFQAAAEALKERLEADGSVKARYAFRQTAEETIDGGMEQSWRDVRTFPACHKLIFTISW
ncbi:MAG TPA: hypothetical protein VL283_01730 [Candidatus Baltobacteraceae bacterium]|nr:hypothetical protein [Candidatus Baltobacteraceae bacterium]